MVTAAHASNLPRRHSPVTSAVGARNSLDRGCRESSREDRVSSAYPGLSTPSCRTDRWRYSSNQLAKASSLRRGVTRVGSVASASDTSRLCSGATHAQDHHVRYYCRAQSRPCGSAGERGSAGATASSRSNRTGTGYWCQPPRRASTPSLMRAPTPGRPVVSPGLPAPTRSAIASPGPSTAGRLSTSWARRVVEGSGRRRGSGTTTSNRRITTVAGRRPGSGTRRRAAAAVFRSRRLHHRWGA